MVKPDEEATSIISGINKEKESSTDNNEESTTRTDSNNVTVSTTDTSEFKTGGRDTNRPDLSSIEKELEKDASADDVLEQLVTGDLPSRKDVLNPKKKEAVNMIMRGVKILAGLNDDPNEQTEKEVEQSEPKDKESTEDESLSSAQERLQRKVDIIRGKR